MTIEKDNKHVAILRNECAHLFISHKKTGSNFGKTYYIICKLVQYLHKFTLKIYMINDCFPLDLVSFKKKKK